MSVRRINMYVALPLSSGALKLFQLGCEARVPFLRAYGVYGGVIKRSSYSDDLLRKAEELHAVGKCRDGTCNNGSRRVAPVTGQ